MITLTYLRSFRLGTFAIFDFALAYVGVYLLVPLLNKLISPIYHQLSHFQWMLLVLPIGIVFHLITGNMTPLTKQALDPSGYYLLKIILLAMLYFGLRKS